MEAIRGGGESWTETDIFLVCFLEGATRDSHNKGKREIGEEKRKPCIQEPGGKAREGGAQEP